MYDDHYDGDNHHMMVMIIIIIRSILDMEMKYIQCKHKTCHKIYLKYKYKHKYKHKYKYKHSATYHKIYLLTFLSCEMVAPPKTQKITILKAT